MSTELGTVLVEARRKRGWSLRYVEDRTGIHNAHLSQIETGGIEKPDPNVLFALASLYGIDFRRLMRLAGHTEPGRQRPRRSLAGTALRALDELTPREQEEVVAFMAKLRRSRGVRGKGS